MTQTSGTDSSNSTAIVAIVVILIVAVSAVFGSVGAIGAIGSVVEVGSISSNCAAPENYKSRPRPYSCITGSHSSIHSPPSGRKVSQAPSVHSGSPCRSARNLT